MHEELTGHPPDIDVGKWIPVMKRLPEGESHVLVYAGLIQPDIEIAYYFGGEWLAPLDDDVIDNVRYWQPLPQPPEGGMKFCKYMSEDGQDMCGNADSPAVANYCPVTVCQSMCRFYEETKA